MLLDLERVIGIRPSAVIDCCEEAWKVFDWSFEMNITVPYQSLGGYDPTSSVYLLGKTSNRDVFETTGIQSIQLPARFLEDLEMVSVEWNEFDFGMHIIDFRTVIEEHDLMGCISFVPGRLQHLPYRCYPAAIFNEEDA
ncbi:unnamed protein product [Cyclocybe aegerita]|uniref:Uncharacterized protein n=1 Tax=Cyclocybe aegerita TaxID=1973307 RepID=A0A8S0X1X1_CYCAE|nr:unnamed protein product [Cyclocybe aegerita]